MCADEAEKEDREEKEVEQAREEPAGGAAAEGEPPEQAGETAAEAEKPGGPKAAEPEAEAGPSRVRTYVGVGALVVAIVVFWYIAFYRHSARFYAGQLSSGDLPARRDAAQKLSEMGEGATPALEALVKALDDPAVVVRMNASAAISGMGAAAYEKAIPLLLELAQNGKGDGRGLAIGILGRIGLAAQPAAATLLKQARDSSPAIRKACLDSLARIAPGRADVVDAMFTALRDKQDSVRSTAAGALGGFARKDKAVFARLTGLALKATGVEQAAAVQAVVTMGAHAREAAPALLALARKAATRRLAMDALFRVAPGLPETLNLWLNAVRTGKSKDQRVAAAGVVADIALQDEKALASVKQALAGLPKDARAVIERRLRVAKKL